MSNDGTVGTKLTAQACEHIQNERRPTGTEAWVVRWSDILTKLMGSKNKG